MTKPANSLETIPLNYLQLLEALRVRYQFPPFPDPLPSTQFHLQLDKEQSEVDLVVTINFVPVGTEVGSEEKVTFFCELGEYEPEYELKILREVAQANFFWGATGGGTLSAQLEERKVYLAYQRPMEFLTEEKFIVITEQFATIAQNWAVILKLIREEEGNPGKPI